MTRRIFVQYLSGAREPEMRCLERVYHLADGTLLGNFTMVYEVNYRAGTLNKIRKRPFVSDAWLGAAVEVF